MEFLIIRTSSSGFDPQKPCEGAKKKELRYPSSKKVIERWAIEINTLEELLELIDKEGTSIIFESSKYREIEIYDGYRE